MRSRVIALAVVMTLLIASLPALAGSGVHEKFKIVGTVVKVQAGEVAVKAVDGATYEIDMDDGTVVTDRQHKKLDRKELKAGLEVVVQALGHDMFDLVAFEVQLVDR